MNGTATTATTCLLGLALAACGGGGGGGDAPPPVEPIDPVLAEQDIGPEGGVLTVVSGPNAGTALAVPAGAVAQPTRFRLVLDVANDRIPSIFPVYRFEAGSVSFQTSPVTVSIRAGEFLPLNGGGTVSMFTRADTGSRWVPVPGATFDPLSRTMTANTTALGEFVVWDGNLHRLFTKEFELHDPATPVATEFVGGVQVVVDNGSIPVDVGQGSLVSFWNSPAADNVIVLHGLIGSPLDFLGGEDLVPNLALIKQNVLLVTYSSARGIAEPANQLYDLIKERAQPGFGCSIVAHSLGGLVGRYLIERSAQDPDRAGFEPTDVSLAGVVDQLVMLGVPNAGAQQATLPFAVISQALPESERWLLQAADDLSERGDSLPILMNQSYVDNATRYHLICGDLGNGSDGVVSVASVQSLPLTAPESLTVFQASHDDLHLRATSLGIAMLIGTQLQAP